MNDHVASPIYPSVHTTTRWVRFEFGGRKAETGLGVSTETRMLNLQREKRGHRIGRIGKMKVCGEWLGGQRHAVRGGPNQNQTQWRAVLVVARSGHLLKTLHHWE